MEYKYKVSGNSVKEAINTLNIFGFCFFSQKEDEIVSPWKKEDLNNVIDNLGLNISLQEV